MFIKKQFRFIGLIAVCFCISLHATPEEPKKEDFTPDFVAQCKIKAEQGDAEGQAHYGRALVGGWGVAVNHIDAVKWLRKAADAGNASAQCSLGVCYLYGMGVEKDAAKAVEWYRKAVEQGLPRAQYLLGVSYETGNGVAKNDAKAVELYRKSAEQGFDGGQFKIGLRLVQENDLAKQNEGVEWLTKAAEQGNADAQTVLGIYYEDKDAGKSLEWYRKAAEQGVGQAQWEVGRVLYRSGDEAQIREAIPYLTNASENGHGMACATLARCYAEGKGVKQDLKRAVSLNKKGAELNVIPCMIWLSFNDPDTSKRHEWLLKGAELGDANCQYLVGMNYHNGLGVAKDINKALEWYRKAAEQGHKDSLVKYGFGWYKEEYDKKNYVEAANWLRKMFLAGDKNPNHWFLLGSCEKEQGHLEEAHKWHRKAAEQGLSYAQVVVGFECLQGKGVDKDLDSAIFWFKKAADQGDKDAEEILQKLGVR